MLCWFLGRVELGIDHPLGEIFLLVCLQLIKICHIFRLESAGEKWGDVVFPWEHKFRHVSLAGSDIVSSNLPSTSKFGHSLRPESVGKELVDLFYFG